MGISCMNDRRQLPCSAGERDRWRDELTDHIKKTVASGHAQPF